MLCLVIYKSSLFFKDFYLKNRLERFSTNGKSILLDLAFNSANCII